MRYRGSSRLVMHRIFLCPFEEILCISERLRHMQPAEAIANDFSRSNARASLPRDTKKEERGWGEEETGGEE